ncbi:MAG: GTP cyclohydrolase I FolE [Chitinophagales bacterium]|nr:GTP cyclohydrolase I FolE [Chitinophagales bacterium]
MGLDLSDDSLNDTPRRVAKMYVQEIFSGLHPKNKPSISLFDNKYGYDKMLIEKNITLYSPLRTSFCTDYRKSTCSLPIPHDKVIGLSKINRIVQYYASRPQVQERLNLQIIEGLKEILNHNDVAVVIEANHLCVASRGIRDTNSMTTTASFSGQFENENIKQEFLTYINKK